MSLANDTKTTTEVRRETINWAAELALSSPADTISTSSWTADNGLKIGNLASPQTTHTNTTTTTTVWVNGGRLGAYCNLVNTVVTAGGYTYTKTIIMEITPT